MRVVIGIVVAALLAVAVWFFFFRGDAATDGAHPLAFVPASSPYVFAQREPMPEDLWNRWVQQSDGAVAMYRTQLKTWARMAQANTDDTAARIVAALEAELADEQTARELMDAIGYGPGTQIAFYGVGLAPVLRVALSDPDALRAFVARMEERVGESLPTAEIDGHAYWRFAADDARVEGVVGIFDGHLVATIAPGGAQPEVLRRLLGLTLPEESLADSGALAQLEKDYGYLPYGSGYVDTARLAQALAQASDEVETAFLAALEIDKPAIDEVCRTELEGIAADWPGMNAGTTEFDDNRIGVRFLIRAAPDIAQQLMSLRAPMPALDVVGGDSFFNAGFAMKIDALPTVANALATALAQSPYQCDWLSGLNELGTQARQAANNPAVYAAGPAAHAAHLIVDDVTLDAEGMPSSIAATLLIGSQNPQSLVAMARSFAGEMLPADLAPDGVARPLPTTMLPAEAPADLNPHIAMNDRLIGVSVGPQPVEALQRYLAADDQPGPLMVVGYSGRAYAAYFDFLQRTMDQMAAEDDAATDPELAELQASFDAMRAYYVEVLDRADMRVEATEHGIAVEQTMLMH